MSLEITLYGAEYPEGTVAVFGISTKRDNREMFSKVFPIEDNKVLVFFSNAETKRFVPGEHRWDLRIVTDPEYEEDGSICCEDAGDNVLSVFSGTGMPAFVVTEVSVHV